MKEHNKKYKYVKKLRDLLESKGWKIKETEFPFSGTIYVGTTLMEWKIQRSTKLKPILIEFIAAQIEYYVTADCNDFESIEITDAEISFYFEKRNWGKTEKEICTLLNLLESKLNTCPKGTDILNSRPKGTDY
ncbi:MAG: hypothetical protein NE328_08315 [Lentisphaeraceae bacterium]|nr:hypothetical protein [Lentisphaeraceae bacterium]